MREYDIFSDTNVGLKRPNNEDSCGFLDKENFKLILVADGMGGHASGEVASKMAKDMVLQLFDLETDFESVRQIKNAVKRIVKRTNSAIHKLSITKDFYGMGTTLVFALVSKDVTVIINCGDSRCYKWEENKLVQLTSDQTVVQYLYQVGAMSKEETLTSPQRHVLMNAMGVYPSVDYDILFIPNTYDGLMCCSDGLTNMLSKEDIEQIVLKSGSAQEKTAKLINGALEKGGIDNISVSLLEVK